MTHFTEKLRLREMADEDIYFARHDVELIEALHQKRLAELANCDSSGDKQMAKVFEDRFEVLTEKHKDQPSNLLHSYRSLLDDIKKVCKKHG